MDNDNCKPLVAEKIGEIEGVMRKINQALDNLNVVTDSFVTKITPILNQECNPESIEVDRVKMNTSFSERLDSMLSSINKHSELLKETRDRIEL